MRILKILTIALALLFMGGCTVLPPKPPKSPSVVNVPVGIPVPPPPSFVPIPLPTDDLKPSDRGDYAKIATAYANSLIILQKEVKTLATQLDAYHQKAPIKAPPAATLEPKP